MRDEALAGVRIEGLLEVRECPHGRGVFALRNLAPGELIRLMPDMLITTAPKSPPWKRWALIIGRTPEGQRLFWDEEADGSSEYWSNFLDHGQEPNVRFSIDIGTRTARLLAVSSIKSGEELLLNYKEYDPDNWAPG
jgi:hypothetical protein